MRSGTVGILKIAFKSGGETTFEEYIFLGRVDLIKLSTGAEVSDMLTSINKCVNEMLRIRMIVTGEERSHKIEND
jgi:hypothetical protein